MISENSENFLSPIPLPSSVFSDPRSSTGKIKGRERSRPFILNHALKVSYLSPIQIEKNVRGRKPSVSMNQGCGVAIIPAARP